MAPSPRCLQGGTVAEVSAGFESEGNARKRRSRSFLYNGNDIPVVLFLYTSIVSCNFLRKSFGYKADSLASCVHACFTCLILTLKQAPRMHQNAPLPDRK